MMDSDTLVISSSYLEHVDREHYTKEILENISYYFNQLSKKNTDKERNLKLQFFYLNIYVTWRSKCLILQTVEL